MIKLINDDCLSAMTKMIDNNITVDLIVTDPPYLVNYKTNHRIDKTHDFCKPILNDNNPQIIKEFISLAHELLKDTGAFYCFCNDIHIDFFKQEIEKYFKLKNILVWEKNNHTAGDLKGAYGKKKEFIIFATKGRHILNGRRDVDILKYNRVSGNRQLHQNEKPVDLLEFLIQKSSNENDIVLDLFMGSGSTGVACKNLNRRFIGIELDENYYRIAEKRIKNHVTINSFNKN